MDELKTLQSLARAMGVAVRYKDGLGKPVVVGPDTLVRVCGALGALVTHPGDAADALRARRAARTTGLVPPVLVAWDGALTPLQIVASGPARAEVQLEDGSTVPLENTGDGLRAERSAAS